MTPEPWSEGEIAEKRQVHLQTKHFHPAVCATCRWLATLDQARAEHGTRYVFGKKGEEITVYVPADQYVAWVGHRAAEETQAALVAALHLPGAPA